MCIRDRSECGTSLWKPPKFDLRFLFLVVTLAAIWFALLRFQNWGSMSVISVIMLTYLFGCPRTRNAVLTVVPAMYLPFSWPFLELLSRDNYWIGFLTWGEAPGLVPGFYFIPYHFDTLMANWLAPIVFTLFIFFGGVLSIRFSNKSRWWFAVPLFELCLFFAIVADPIYIE